MALSRWRISPMSSPGSQRPSQRPDRQSPALGLHQQARAKGRGRRTAVTFPTLCPAVLLPTSSRVTSSSSTISGRTRARPSGKPSAKVGAELFFLPKYSPRAALRQAQAPAAKGGQTYHRRGLQRHRPNPRHRHTKGMRQLLHRGRLCPNLK